MKKSELWKEAMTKEDQGKERTRGKAKQIADIFILLACSSAPG